MIRPGGRSTIRQIIAYLKQAEGRRTMRSKGWIHDNRVDGRLGLTRREIEVLTWVAGGKSNAAIGLILGASPRTVQKHLEHIFEKLGVETRTAAIARVFTINLHHSATDPEHEDPPC